MNKYHLKLADKLGICLKQHKKAILKRCAKKDNPIFPNIKNMIFLARKQKQKITKIKKSFGNQKNRFVVQALV